MKHKTILLSIFLVMIIMSCQKEELSVPMNSVVMLLDNVTLDDQPYYQYSYNDSDLIVEEGGKLDFTIHRYNEKNQLIASDYYWNTSILSTDIKAIATTLSQSAFVTSASGSKGAAIKYEYGSNDQLTKVTYTRAGSSGSEYATFTYDQNNRIDKQILYWNNTETGHIDYFYDGNRNLIKENLYDKSSTGSDELSTTTDYAFDKYHNPYKSFKGLMMPGLYTNSNNIVKEVCTIHLASGQGADKVQATENTYEYNANGYPITKNGNMRFTYE